MEEKIQVVEPCEQFPVGLYTGDEIVVSRISGVKRTARVCGPKEWELDRPTSWPSLRDNMHGGKVPYILDHPGRDHYACWVAAYRRIELVRSVWMEESGQLLMF